MKKATLMITLVTITVMILILFSSNIRIVEASNDSNYTIEHINHTIEGLDNGYIIINDTIRISGEMPDAFYIGFPYKYGSHVIRCVAYNSTNAFPVTINVPLENHIGFYGVKIGFPLGAPQIFNVAFLMSNTLIRQNTLNQSLFLLDFPAYPALTKPTSVCNTSIILQDAIYLSGTVGNFTYWQQNLTAFTYSPANVTFLLTGSKMQRLDIKELKREISIDERGEISGSDTYYIVNKGLNQTSSIELILPHNATNQNAQDQFGRALTGTYWVSTSQSRLKIFLSVPLETNKSSIFTVNYILPSQLYVTSQDRTSYLNINSLMFKNLTYYVEQASINIVLPEGAKILIFGNYSITKDAVQETLTINLANISPFDTYVPSEEVEPVAFEYNPLWSAFRPTILMWALSIVSVSIFVVWRRPKAPMPITSPVTTAKPRLRQEDIKSVIDTYEEKRKITLELESLENKAKKGKIPRRRYKVQRKTLETRLSVLSRTLAESKEKMRVAGGQYSDLMRQLEIAEIGINEVESNIRSIEARHNRGELSLEAYRKLLTEYEQRKEKANTTISGILIRLREETR